ncbi:MAG: GNAT family N-acetyltransferase [Defluviitaleaceae bacterium]|nr:GNAT family N-acetyltransferase [Defluviitaleaceae bacterium]
MEIVNMKSLNAAQLSQAAQMLTDEMPLGWAAFEDAMREVDYWVGHAGESSETGRKLGGSGRITFLAALEDGEVIGWCGILPSYGGNVFELHPLVVRRDWQRKGVGTALVNAVSDAAREQGGLTIWLGADDEKPGGQTSLANADLYDDLPGKMEAFEPGDHQAAFYLKAGFKVVGVMPDADGRGKPDIFLAMRL